MAEAKRKIRKKKAALTFLHIVFMLCLIAGVSAMYLSANYGRGVKWIFDDVYEDSESFSQQLAEDISNIFTYAGYKNMFETNGKLDMYKPIMRTTNGPGDAEEWTLDDVVRYGKMMGYYLDGDYNVAGAPWSMGDDDEDQETEVDIAYYTDNPSFLEATDLAPRMTKYELVMQLLGHLGKYYKTYNYYVDGATNLYFRISYTSDGGEESLYTNMEGMSVEEMRDAGKYLYIQGNTVEIYSNLSVIPNNAATLLERWNPYSNDQNYMVVAVDTSYPNDDAYSAQAAAYGADRNAYIMGMGGVILGLVGCFATLLFMTIVSGHVDEESDEIRLYPIDEIYTEFFLILWAVGSAVAIVLIQYAGIRLISLFAAEEQWDYWNKVVRIVSVYVSLLLCGFALIRRYKARCLWKCSLIKKLRDALEMYMGRVSYAGRMGTSYLSFLGGNVLALWGLIFLFANRDEKPVYRLLFIALVVVLAGVDGLIFHILFKKSVQRDLLDAAVSNISKGDTNYRIDTEKLTGKERNMGEHINNISSGLGTALMEQVKSERMKADLITNVSHDIKTPLTSIINYVDLIKREKIDNPKVAAYLEVLDQKSQRLKTLTEDLVEASKASSGNLKLEMADINLVELVQQTIGEFEERFEQRRLELVQGLPEDALIIRADGRRLWRVLENLYTNAFKYAMEHSRVYVDVKEDGDRAIFTMKNVSEKPLNISPSELTERFVRGDVSRTTEGSGLGLSIAQSLTELQGGVFSLEIDGDLFKVSVIFPLERCEKKGERTAGEALTETKDQALPEEGKPEEKKLEEIPADRPQNEIMGEASENEPQGGKAAEADSGKEDEPESPDASEKDPASGNI